MIAAFMFDPEHPLVAGFHGHNIEALIFKTDVLQRSGEQLVIRGGDLILGQRSGPFYGQIQEVLGGPLVIGRPDHGRLRADDAYGTALHSVIFAIVIHGISHETAMRLEQPLLKTSACLGWKKLDFDYEPHRQLLGQYLLDRYRILGRTIEVPPADPFSDEPALPDHLVETLKSWGFEEVSVAAKAFGMPRG